ncbi:MAG: UDP-N-acetylmuramate:L-alanyl-gamma-D-glutamyl-meso-diaminopimelate ligase [Verrucomicrobiales bacterium]|nr:UDP-N-acetylmuramate:L-alanyl-gamma-D-glutamyl-meso-diaminopimelate ligase [Verrucomicrobiales bacterium]
MSEILENGKHLYFMGICGTAMGSVAAAFRDAGYRVTGSDAQVYDPMKSFLESRGIEILNGYKAENLPDDVDLFVIGNAQSRGNPEVEEVMRRKLHYISLPELLRDQVLRGKRNFVVSGTHGKTTTASLLAWLFESAGKNPGFVIGGIPGNLGQGARFTDSDINVLEGDEYDSAFFDKRSKFINYLPEVAIVNNIEFDHADIFDDLNAIKRTFGHMVRLVPGNGMVLLNGDDRNCLDVFQAQGHSPMKRVGFAENCEARITNVEYAPESTTFEIEGEHYVLPLNGEFNVRNGAMAITAARFGGLSVDEIRAALLAFSGIKRRQEVRGVTDRNITVIDDFGHHPTAIREAITGLRRKYEGSRMWAIFEPRSNTTRRNVFQEALPEALGQADAVCIAAVARADQLDVEERLDTDLMMETLRAGGKPAYYEPDVEAIVNRLSSEAEDGDVIIVFSNGGFGGIHEKLLNIL